MYPETYENVNRYSKSCEHVNCQQDYRTLADLKGEFNIVFISLSDTLKYDIILTEEYSKKVQKCQKSDEPMKKIELSFKQRYSYFWMIKNNILFQQKNWEKKLNNGPPTVGYALHELMDRCWLVLVR